jgi:hypothetical protein
MAAIPTTVIPTIIPISDTVLSPLECPEVLVWELLAVAAVTPEVVVGGDAEIDGVDMKPGEPFELLAADALVMLK